MQPSWRAFTHALLDDFCRPNPYMYLCVAKANVNVNVNNSQVGNQPSQQPVSHFHSIRDLELQHQEAA
jgi:hypothetical protein